MDFPGLLELSDVRLTSADRLTVGVHGHCRVHLELGLRRRREAHRTVLLHNLSPSGHIRQGRIILRRQPQDTSDF